VRLERLARLLEKQGRHIEAAPIRLYAARSLEDNGYCREGLAVSWPGTPDGFTPSCTLDESSSEASASESNSLCSLSELHAPAVPLDSGGNAPLCSVAPAVASASTQLWWLPFNQKQYNMKLACMLALLVSIVATECLGFGGLLATQS